MNFAEARACVLEQVHAQPPAESIETLDAEARVLAEDVAADRDYPPVARSVRDGFAVRSADAAAGLRVIGEVRAGEAFAGAVGSGEAVEIMTGAPVPAGADAIVMVEHVVRDGDRITTDRRVRGGDFVNPAGSEARRGEPVLTRGRRLDFAAIAMAATVGRTRLQVYQRPRVAIVPTGDELVEVGDTPRDFEVRNSNAWSLAAQVRRAGGLPRIMPVARDTYDATRAAIEAALASDLVLLSGGVSAGKYDVVERVLADLGAEFFFDRVRIQPGQPVVFGQCRGKFFFGLPGNPGSTMVTFELFARAALERLSGVSQPLLPLLHARLKTPFRHHTGLMRFLPAVLDDSGDLTPLKSKGSSDVPALARANAFLVAEQDRESWAEGELIRVLLK